MDYKKIKQYFNFVAFFGFCCVSPVSAQQATSASHEDWQIRCAVQNVGEKREVKDNPPAKNQKTVQACEIETNAYIVQHGQKMPGAILTVGRDPSKKALHVLAKVPLMGWLPKPPKLFLVSGKELLTLSYTHCLEKFCLAQGDLSDQKFYTLVRDTEASYLLFVGGNHQEEKYLISKKGLAQTYEAMLKATAP